MPLQERLAPFAFSAGLNTKLDPKSPRLAGQLLQANNVVFTRPDRLTLRNGYQSFPTAIDGGGEITDGNALMSYQNELVLCDHDALYSWNPGSRTWVRKGALSSLVVEATPVCRNTNVAATADGCVHVPTATGIYAWQDAGGFIRYSIVSLLTGSTLVSNALLGAGQLPKALVVGDFLCVYWVTAGVPVINLALIPVANTTAAPVVTPLTSSSAMAQELNGAVPVYDVCLWPSAAAPTSLYVTWNNASSGGTSLAWYDPNDPGTQLTLTNWANPADLLNVFPDVNGPVVLSWYGSADTEVRFRAWQDFATAAIATPAIAFLPIIPGGSLAAGTYTWRISAVDGSGRETAASAPDSITVPAGSSVTILWNAVTGAASYNVYGRLAGLEMKLGNTTSLSFSDDGTITPAPPAAPNYPVPVQLAANTIVAQANLVALGGVAVDDAPTWQLFYTQLGLTVVSLSATWTAQVASYTPGAATVAQPSLALVGKPFLYEGAAWATFLHQTSVLSGQSTYFVGDSHGNVNAKFLYGVAATAILTTAVYPAPLLAEVSLLTSSQFSVALVEAIADTTIEGNTLQNYGVTAYVWDFNDPQDGYSRAQLAQTLVIGGGFAAQYDGATVSELGFHYCPDVFISAAPISGGVLQAGTYAFIAVYAWTDNRGHIQRSGPSEPVLVTVTAGQGVELVVPYLGVTAHQGAWIEIYRTVVNVADVYYLANATAVPLASPTTNASILNVRVVAGDPTEAVATFLDLTVSDAQLVGNPPFYGNGGVASNIMPNAIKCLVVWDNRIWGVDPNPLLLWMTRQAIPGTPPEFSDSLQFNVDPRGEGTGGVTALGWVDANFIICKQDLLFYTSGQGPDNTGAGSYPDAAFCSSAVGCANQRSIGVVPQGMVFDSEKGRWLLDHSLNTSYLGAPVERYNGELSTSCQLIPTTNEIRWTLQQSDLTPSGTILLYDFFVGQWATFSPTPGVDAAVWQGTYLFLQPNGVVSQETPGAYTDDGEFIGLLVETSNLQLGGQQAWQQVWDVMILGTYASPHMLEVSVFTDFSPAPDQDDTVAPGEPLTWGSDSTWGGLLPGDSLTWGGGWTPYQWRAFLVNTECEAVRIRIETKQQEGEAPGQGCSLSGLTLTYGAFGRTIPVPVGRQF